MALFDKLNQVAKNIGNKTSDAIETGRLNSRINSEKAAAGEELAKIGEFYYTKYAESGEAEPELIELYQSIKAHYAAADEAKAEIERIRSDNAPAPASAPAAAPAQLFCRDCGAAYSAGTKFCPSCGARLEPEAPKERFCPECGVAIEPGVRFCGSCGHKMEG